jgi:hypothetical protein
MVVDVDQSELHPPLLLAIVLVELHLRQQQFRVVVELHLEVSSFRHVPHYLRGVAARLHPCAGLVHRQRPSFWVSVALRKEWEELALKMRLMGR